MKNPLIKRLPRELWQDRGKYIALFLFLVATIGFVSGYLVADNSMTSAYNNSFTKYDVEDGRFTLADPAEDSLIQKLADENVSVYKLFYKDVSLQNEDTIRFYRNRTEVNRACLMKGRIPDADDEIAIDRLYAENNQIELNDSLQIDGSSFRVTAFVALPDYSALFKNNSDMMFNATHFTIAIVTDNAFDTLNENGLKYCYAWRNNDRTNTDKQASEKADDLKDLLIQTGKLTDFVKRADNQAINFTGDDMGNDRIMIMVLLYVVMAVLAFVFGITTKSTIEQEASAIGTLRASGYTRGELLRHYLALPTLITLVAALFGNILGYTFMKEIVIGLYYGSYSLTTYSTLWNADAFLKTTVAPCLIILIVNLLMLVRLLSLSPLKFLQHEFSKSKKRRVVRLPEWKFLTRFRLRVILQNRGAYLTLFVGIFLASLILIFGMVMTPMISHFKTEVLDSKISDYQYVLKAPIETENNKAEKYAMNTLNIENGGEEITIYGISESSKYLKDIDLPTDKKEVLISEGYAEKYDISVGDTIMLENEYESDAYKFTVSGTYPYAASLCVFISRELFNNTFEHDIGYYNGYFSEQKLADISDNYIATIITKDDLTTVSDQLGDSVGAMFPLISGFAAIIYILLMYLLAKLVVEKNSSSLSMLKILGYSNSEATSIYNHATALVVGLSLIITLPLDALAMKELYNIFMQRMNGWMTYYVAAWIYPAMIGIGMVCYAVVHLIQTRRIAKVALSQALKNME